MTNQEKMDSLLGKNQKSEQKNSKKNKIAEKIEKERDYSSVLGVSGREFNFLMYSAPLDDETFADIYNEFVEDEPLAMVTGSKINYSRKKSVKIVEPILLKFMYHHLGRKRYIQARKHYHTQGIATNGVVYTIRTIDTMVTVTEANKHIYFPNQPLR